MSEVAKRTSEEDDEQVDDVVDRLRGAAKEVERLRSALKKLRSAARDTAVYADAPKTHEMDDGEAGVVCAWEVLHNLRLAITDADAAVA